MQCKARRYHDQTQCGRCGLAWDVNDPEPPRCPVDEHPETGRRWLAKIKLALPETGGYSSSTHNATERRR